MKEKELERLTKLKEIEKTISFLIFITYICNFKRISN